MTSRVEHWLRCREKRCCFDSAVFVTGAEVALIARTVSVPPWAFTAPLAAQPDADDGFALDASGRRWRLALRRVQFPDEDAHCAFLLRFASGNTRCGLGGVRPGACRVFPLEGGSETCVCAWSGVALDDAATRDEVAQLASDRDHYAGVVRAWNAYVKQRGEMRFQHEDFCRFLLDAYAEAGR